MGTVFEMSAEEVETLSNVKRHYGLKTVPNKTKSQIITSNQGKALKSSKDAKDILPIADKTRSNLQIVSTPQETSKLSESKKSKLLKNEDSKEKKSNEISKEAAKEYIDNKGSDGREYHTLTESEKDNMHSEKCNMRIEKHRLTICEHSLVANHMKFCERKEKIEVSLIDINIAEDEGTPVKNIIYHTRSIDERIYSTKITTGPNGDIIDSQVITELSDNEVQEFEHDWKQFWIPKITDEEIEKAINMSMYEAKGDKVTIQELKEEKIEVEAFENMSAQSDSDGINVLDRDQTNQSVEINDSLNQTIEYDVVHYPAEEDDVITKFVKAHPLKVFYTATFALVFCTLITQCCFLPDYPPCSRKKCILECIEEANSEDF